MRSKARLQKAAFPTCVRRYYLDTVEVWRSSRHGPNTVFKKFCRSIPTLNALHAEPGG
jgi:hypothetical protein